MKKGTSLTLALFLSAAHAQTFPPECPRAATADPVADPAAWADTCFMAQSGRLPNAASGESARAERDIDLDGVPERLEIRGSGKASKQIYVFEQRAETYHYVGMLDALPDFEIIPRDGQALIRYVHRFGDGDHRLITFRYDGVQFVELASEPYDFPSLERPLPR